MNLLTGKFISTTVGKVSLKDVLTSDTDYELQYFFDEIQLAMFQLLGSLSTIVLKPTMDELRSYLRKGVTENQYDDALKSIDLSLFEAQDFMCSKSDKSDSFVAPITKMISGIECGGSANAFGLFSEISCAEVICTDCAPVLNYNLHMNIKGECFSKTGATGIRGGGAISTLISAKTLKQTILANTIAIDFFTEKYEYEKGVENALMWEKPPEGDVYYAHKIGLERGLFSLAYHIKFNVLDAPCICDVCGATGAQSIREFSRLKYTGVYGSTKNGRELGAGWWPHPYTPTTKKQEGIFAVCARGQGWQSWQNFTSYIIGQETDKALSFPAPIVEQYKDLVSGHANLLVGGNIADQGSVIGRVYDMYPMPEHWDANLARITKVIKEGLRVKERLSMAINKIFSAGYDKTFVAGIKENAMQQFVSNAQSIIQGLLLDLDRKSERELRKEALKDLKQEAVSIHRSLISKYQHDLPLFKALVKGEKALFSLGLE